MIRCPYCGRVFDISQAIKYWETDEEGEKKLGMGADPETVRWYLTEIMCPYCRETFPPEYCAFCKHFNLLGEDKDKPWTIARGWCEIQKKFVEGGTLFCEHYEEGEA